MDFCSLVRTFRSAEWQHGRAVAQKGRNHFKAPKGPELRHVCGVLKSAYGIKCACPQLQDPRANYMTNPINVGSKDIHIYRQVVPLSLWNSVRTCRTRAVYSSGTPKYISITHLKSQRPTPVENSYTKRHLLVETFPKRIYIQNECIQGERIWWDLSAVL